jgi:hypothetical protein
VARSASGWDRCRPRSRQGAGAALAGRFGAFLAKPGERNAEQQRVVDYSDALIGELKRADVIVLGLPMYNFGVPSTREQARRSDHHGY